MTGSEGDVNEAGEQGVQLRFIRADELIAEQVCPVFRSPSVRLLRGDMLEEIEEAGRILDGARRGAVKIEAEASERAEALFAEARLKGLAKGAEEMLETLAAARRVYAGALDEAEQDMLDMAFRLAEHIVGEAIEFEPKKVQRMVEKVLVRARGKRQITVRVAPGDLRELEASGAQLCGLVDGVSVHLQPDPALTRGGCVIETESGRIDGRVEVQFNALRAAIARG